MLNIISAKGENFAILPNQLAVEMGKLYAAHEKGYQFLILPIHDSLTSIKWILASFHSPLTIVPVSPNLPADALDEILHSFPAKKAALFSEIEKINPASAIIKEKDLDEIWAVIFTSGSSGKPKGVALSGHALKNSALSHAKHLTLSSDHTWLLNLPAYHIGGFSIITRAYFLNSTIAATSAKFVLDETLAWLNSGKIAGLSIVPTILKRILENNQSIPNAVRHILLGGAAVDKDLLAKARSRHFPIHLTYGMTEHCSQIATEKFPGAGLSALPGVNIKISVDGEICVHSKALAAGYFQLGSFSALSMDQGYFNTGDLGENSSEGLIITGRKSDLIISGGINIFPAEIEAHLAKFSAFKDSAITSIPSPEWGEQVVGIYVSENSNLEVENAAYNFLSQKIDHKKLPKVWIAANLIPRSSNGKVRRQELRNMAIKSVSKARPSAL